MCEEFGKLPTEIAAELDRVPAGMLEEILEARAYAKAYAVRQQDPRVKGGMVDDVTQIEFALAQEAMDGE